MQAMFKMIQRLKEPHSDIQKVETKAVLEFSYIATLLDLMRNWKFKEIPTVFVKHELKLLHLSN